MAIRKEAAVQHGFTQDEITAAVKATLESLWGCAEKAPALFESDIGMTLWSFGTLLTVDLTETGIIKVASETKLPTALVDFGTNQGNINKFLGALKENLAAGGLAESNPEAVSSLATAESVEVRDASSRKEGLSTLLLIGIIAAVLIVITVICIVGYLAVALIFSSF